jgi:hypothetical protein
MTSWPIFQPMVLANFVADGNKLAHDLQLLGHRRRIVSRESRTERVEGRTHGLPVLPRLPGIKSLEQLTEARFTDGQIIS